MRSIGQLLHRGWWYLCASLLVVLVAGRWLRYVTVSPPPAVDHLLGSLMILEAHLFLWPWVITSVFVENSGVLIAALPIFLMRRRLFRRVDGVWRFTRLLIALSCAGMLWLLHRYDVNTFVASLCATSLALAWVAGRLEKKTRTTGARLATAGLVAALFIWFASAGDSADGSAVALWAFVLLVGRPHAARVLGEREVWLSLLVLGGLMTFGAHLFLPSLLAETGVVLIPVLPLFLMRKRLFSRVDGVWRFTPLLISLLCAGTLWLQYLFDVNTFVASLCATSLALAWVAGSLQKKTRTTGARLATAGLVAVLCAWFALAGDFADRSAVVLWAFVLLVGRPYAARVLGEREVWLSLLLAVMPINLLPAVLPLALPMHGGTLFGTGMAYSFCEVPKHDMLLASLPACTSVNNSYDRCGEGRVVGYDRATLKPVRTYRFFSPEYFGRLESLVCLDDEVQVAVQATRYDGRFCAQTALSFPLASPADFTPLVAGEGVGSSIAYDAAHDALFYAGEYTHRIVRYDRRTGRTNDKVGEAFRRRWRSPLDLKSYTGSLIMLTASIHPERNRLYLADWMQGRYAYALDLSTLDIVARYDVQDGGNLGISVDAERDRLFVVGLWGMEVFDLATEKLIARKRLGLGNRPVVVDRARNRLYVSSSVEGKIRILDRDTFRTIGQIAIGLGSRYPYLSLDGRRFFASSSVAHYYWDGDTL